MKSSQLFVRCLEKEGVEYIFGIPGEENIDFMDALTDSDQIRFVVTRHEQGASFMADIYGRLTGKAGVCLATLGPGAINLTLGAANAQLDSSPLVALAGQGALKRLTKESHQAIDLVALFRPISKCSSMITVPDMIPETIRKAFKVAQTERPGTSLIVFPEDVAKSTSEEPPMVARQPKPTAPYDNQIRRAAKIIRESSNPIILAGYGVCRSGAAKELTDFAESLKIPVVSTFMGKGTIPYDNDYFVGTVGFMRHDYVNFGFDKADTIIAVGYDLVEYSPASLNPARDKKLIHIHSAPAEVDAAYDIEVGVLGHIPLSLNTLKEALSDKVFSVSCCKDIKETIEKELSDFENDDSFPVKPQRIVSAMKKVMGREDILLCDTGALKSWVARLFPCYAPNTCIMSNGLGTMSFSLPGAIAAKLVNPDKKVLAVMGDGSFMMNSQELETAKREGAAIVVLIWKDSSYGLIKWKQEIEFGRSCFIEFDNPDFVKYAESFGIKGYRVEKASQLLPILNEAFSLNAPVVIECDVDYSENMKLVDTLEHSI